MISRIVAARLHHLVFVWIPAMSRQTIAALDMGSNTFRLMLADKSGDALKGPGRVPVESPSHFFWDNKQVFQHIPRLSERLTNGGHFAPEALERAWEALGDFAGHIREAGADRVLAGATMAARLAADGKEFMAAINKRYGWETVILTGAEEARLTATGTLTGLDPLPPHALIFDIGGRSTEFISSKQSEIIKTRSLSLGVVALTEAHLSDPAAPGELEAVAEEVRAVLSAADFSDVDPGAVLVGTAGTVTTVAALLLNLKEYRPELVNNARLTGDSISDLLNMLAKETVEERVKNHGLHPRRADAIVAGLVEVMEILNFFGRKELVVSDNGLLEGVWLRAGGLI